MSFDTFDQSDEETEAELKMQLVGELIEPKLVRRIFRAFASCFLWFYEGKLCSLIIIPEPIFHPFTAQNFKNPNNQENLLLTLLFGKNYEEVNLG